MGIKMFRTAVLVSTAIVAVYGMMPEPATARDDMPTDFSAQQQQQQNRNRGGGGGGGGGQNVNRGGGGGGQNVNRGGGGGGQNANRGGGGGGQNANRGGGGGGQNVNRGGGGGGGGNFNANRGGGGGNVNVNRSTVNVNRTPNVNREINTNRNFNANRSGGSAGGSSGGGNVNRMRDGDGNTNLNRRDGDGGRNNNLNRRDGDGNRNTNLNRTRDGDGGRNANQNRNFNQNQNVNRSGDINRNVNRNGRPLLPGPRGANVANPVRLTPGPGRVGPRTRPTNVTVVRLNNRNAPIWREGPRRTYWGGRWRTFVPLAAIGAVAIGGAYYYADGYVSVARPYCDGLSPEGCRLNWQRVDFEDGGSEWQCVQFCRRPNAPPPARTVALAAPPPPPPADAKCELTIYPDPNFGGTAVTTSDEQPALSESGWQNQIASVKVASGTWDFFTEEEFAGENLRLEPGEYPNLGPDWTRKAGSFMCVQP